MCEIVKKYLFMIGEDIVEFVSCVFSWESVWFFFIVFLFGFLMLVDLFLMIMKFLCLKDCVIFMIVVLYIIFMVLLFFILFYISRKVEFSNFMIVIGVFVFVLFIVLIVMVIILFKNRNGVVNR